MVDKTKMLKQMKLGVGSSESCILLLGKAYGKSIEDLYSLKRGFTEPEDLDDVPDIQRGNYLEDLALKKFVKEYDVEVTHTGPKQKFWRDKKNGMLGHTDGLVDGIIPTETKCPRASVWYKVINEGVPDVNQIQVQHQMHLTKAEYAYLIYFCADSWTNYVVEVPRNQRLIDIIVSRCSEFWAGVQAGELITFDPVLDIQPISGTATNFEHDFIEQWRDAEAEKAMVLEDLEEIKVRVMSVWPEDTKKIFGDYGSISMSRNKKTGKVSMRTSFKKGPE